MRFSLWIVFSTALLAGCASQNQAMQYQSAMARQGHELDSLWAEHRVLQRQYATVLDTLYFYDDIDSGRIYRQINALEDRITRLEYDLSVSRDGGLTIATLQADDLFAPASANLTASGAERLAEVAETLQEEHGSGIIRIEGHSDSVPVGGSLKEKYPSNWELSTARASAVARYFMEQQEMEEARIEVVGYGAARPTAPNNTAQGRSLNRRIRIAAMPTVEEPATAATAPD